MSVAERQPSDAILTAPNLISFSRLVLIAPFVYFGLVVEHDGWAWIIGFTLGTTDWVDGYVARRFNQVSKLGVAMDPLIDRLSVFAIAAVILLRDLAPWWAIGAIVLREVLLLAALPVLAAMKVERPAVTRVGKIGFFCLMWGFAFFYAVTIPEPEATWILPVAWGFYAVGVVLAYVAAFGYARAAFNRSPAA